MPSKREVKIGVVGVDSGQLMVCDPRYIDGEWKRDTALHLPSVYRDVNTGQPWQLTESGTWEEYREPPFPEGEFSYAGCCDRTINHPERAGQLIYKMGHDGAGVVFSSGLGDGVYDVYAIYEEVPGWGERIVSVRIDLKAGHGNQANSNQQTEQ